MSKEALWFKGMVSVGEVYTHLYVGGVYVCLCGAVHVCVCVGG